MKMTISPWLIRQREAKKLAHARARSRRGRMFNRPDPILKAYNGVPSWALKQGLVKVRTF